MKHFFFTSVIVLITLFYGVTTSAQNMLDFAPLQGINTVVIHGSVIDNEGNIFIAGRYVDSVDFDPGPGTLYKNTTGNNGTEQDVFIAKYDSNYVPLWVNVFPQFNDWDVAYDIKLDPQQNPVMCGDFKDTIDFDPGPGEAKLWSHSFHRSGFLCKYSSADGSLIFANRLFSTGTSNFGFLQRMDIDCDGNIYVTGHHNGLADFDPGPGNTNIQNKGIDIFVAKYDNNGNYIYASNFESHSYSHAIDIEADQDGNAFVTGQFRDSIDFDPGPGKVMKTSGSTQRTHAFFMKLDASGNLVWVQHLEGEGGGDTGYDLELAKNGDIYLVGNFQQHIDLDPGVGTDIYTLPNNNWDIFLACYDPSGAYKWGNTFGAVWNSESGQSIVIDDNGDIYMSGTIGTIGFDIDPGPGTVNVVAQSCNDGFVAKFDKDGNYIWSTYSQSADCNNIPILTDLNLFNNQLHVMWNGKGTVDFDPGPGMIIGTVTGTNGAYMTKYSGGNAPLNPCAADTLVAAFSTDTVCLGDSTVFVDLTTPADSVIAWKWFFGDGDSSLLQHPKHLYSNAGNYNVQLIAYSNVDTDMVSATVVVDSCPINPITAVFDADTVCFGDSTTFTDLSTPSDSLTAWKWFFGDGDSSLLQHPKHLYGSAGNYVVQLIAYGNMETDTTNATVVVNTCPIIPVVAAFATDTVCLGDSTAFTDLSTPADSAITWRWFFGDGDSSLLQHPKHLYGTFGNFQVTLIVASNTSTDTAMQTVVVDSCMQLTAQFIADTVCATDSVQFTDNSTSPNTITAWNWSFGDGNTSIAQHPKHAYTLPGNYDVRLIVTDNQGMDTVEQNVVADDCSGVTAAFQATPPCLGETVTFTDNSTAVATIQSWRWSFGDGDSSLLQNPTHVYNDTGTFIIRLIVNTKYGADTAFDTLRVNPAGTLTLTNDTTISLGNGVQLEASGGSAYAWTPTASLSCINCGDPYATPSATTLYFVTSNIATCTVKDSVLVTVELKKNFFVPSAFSPGNDDVNEVLYVRGNGIDQINFEIYDRWGIRVFATTDPNTGWDGTWRGSLLNAGVYVYHLSGRYVDGQMFEQQGNISLLKK